MRLCPKNSYLISAPQGGRVVGGGWGVGGGFSAKSNHTGCHLVSISTLVVLYCGSHPAHMLRLLARS